MTPADLARRGAALVRSGKYAPAAAQLPPVGPPPAAEVLLVGALLWPTPDDDPGPVIALVADDDVADPHLAEVLTCARSLIYTRKSVGQVIVADELHRSGRYSAIVADRLTTATTCGAVPAALPGYARAVVSASLRRRVESAGAALTAAAESVREIDLAPLAERAASAVADCAARLEKLRGGVE